MSGIRETLSAQRSAATGPIPRQATCTRTCPAYRGYNIGVCYFRCAGGVSCSCGARSRVDRGGPCAGPGMPIRRSAASSRATATCTPFHGVGDAGGQMFALGVWRTLPVCPQAFLDGPQASNANFSACNGALVYCGRCGVGLPRSVPWKGGRPSASCCYFPDALHSHTRRLTNSPALLLHPARGPPMRSSRSQWEWTVPPLHVVPPLPPSQMGTGLCRNAASRRGTRRP